MSQSDPIHDMEAGASADPRWKELYQLGGIAFLVLAFSTALAIIAFFIWPYEPGFVPTADVFTTLQEDRLGGMISLDLLFILGTLISIVPVLALYVALKRVNESYALLALVLGLIAIVALIPARPIMELVTLSDRYATASTDAARSQILAAGETLLTLFNGTAWIVNMVLAAVSSLISCLLMLQCRIFSKTTAYFGIAINIMILLFFIPLVGMFAALLSTAGVVVFQIMVGLRLLQLAQRSMLPRIADPGS